MGRVLVLKRVVLPILVTRFTGHKHHGCYVHEEVVFN